MANLFESATTITEKREILKQLSQPLKALVKLEAVESINEGLKNIYAEQGHTVLKTIRGWNSEGKRVIKGEKALCLWGSPKKRGKKQESDNTPTEANTGTTEAGENDPLKFFPICFVFSNLQVH
jgi:hypothetical protein